MSWNLSWGGRAVDFTAELLVTKGKVGAITEAASSAAYEALQSIGEKKPDAWVRLSGQGWEEKENEGYGHFSLTVSVVKEPSSIQQELDKQRPVDLLAARGQE